MTAHPDLHSRFAALFPDAPPNRVAPVCEDLLLHYSEPHRHYHTVEHLRACLATLDQTVDSPTTRFRNVVEIALWFHDVWYEQRGVSNERRSAHDASNGCRWLGRADIADDVARCVMATAHGTPPDYREPDAQLVVDVDLSILGAPWAEFETYETQIRAEYAWVLDDAFRVGRARILRGLQARMLLYQRQDFRDRFERQARDNLKRSLAELEAP